MHVVHSPSSTIVVTLLNNLDATAPAPVGYGVGEAAGIHVVLLPDR